MKSSSHQARTLTHLIFDLCCHPIEIAPTHSHQPRMNWGPVVIDSVLAENVWATRPDGSKAKIEKGVWVAVKQPNTVCGNK